MKAIIDASHFKTVFLPYCTSKIHDSFVSNIDDLYTYLKKTHSSSENVVLLIDSIDGIVSKSISSRKVRYSV